MWSLAIFQLAASCGNCQHVGLRGSKESRGQQFVVVMSVEVDVKIICRPAGGCM